MPPTIPGQDGAGVLSSKITRKAQDDRCTRCWGHDPAQEPLAQARGWRGAGAFRVSVARTPPPTTVVPSFRVRSSSRSRASSPTTCCSAPRPREGTRRPAPPFPPSRVPPA